MINYEEITVGIDLINIFLVSLDKELASGRFWVSLA
jgi:hypothetical protein